MKREVIQDFLNLPGIAGIALMDGRSRPYFCGVDRTLNFQQKEALAQGILRVVETIPDGFETFEFHFTGHQVYIYKLEHGIILLVLTRMDLVYSDYLRTIKNLKAVLKEDINNAIATFRLMAGNITLSGVNYHKEKPGTFTNSGITSGSTASAIPTGSGVPPTPPPPSAPPSSSAAPPSTDSPTLKVLLLALNHLSQFTTSYLGNHVIVNYWKSTRPQHEWLNRFEIDRFAHFTFSGSPQEAQKSLSLEEQQWIREWVAAFTKRCALVIRDFPNLVEQKALNEEQKAMLLNR
ncbi:hypothetical protein J5X98_10960 [Leptothermofonsia sichuanensis E412]|uniref:hypothetical protein n=1 Tax=Leptothermofonsia sichuanensis TaxID=2917832 RepID=UPI001CA75EA0|nr:hypothetical protein [Leptothermofonsia sichuanensis]QZZ22820.1 hypothetical protein J5X98_10960 [Leptothermofonsia sichuanensis E412]